MFDLAKSLRPHIAGLEPYSSARDEYSGKEGVFLDANENAIGSVTKGFYNRYPDPYQWALKERIAGLKGLDKAQVFLGNGSDEAIDLLFRAFCSPGHDNVISLPPTYGMYKVSAAINEVDMKEVPLARDFTIDTKAVLRAIDAFTKIVFICSPNNPTGNSFSGQILEDILQAANCLVVVDEAYIDFSKEKSMTGRLAAYPNLVVLQTFSKAWGLAALRLGMAFSSPEIIAVLNKIKPPYNINGITQELALEALQQTGKKDHMVETLLREREALAKALEGVTGVQKTYPSDANFILVKINNARKVYDYLLLDKIIVRDRSRVQLCEDCLRITVGTGEENRQVLKALERL